MSEDAKPKDHFIRDIVEADRAAGKNGGRVVTRFPPEPNGYIHVGHVKSLGINFGLAADYGGTCNLRFDDTNPEKEEIEYVTSIKEDIRWLGYDWQDREYYASDYYEKLYGFAEDLIRKGQAYVCDLTAEQVTGTRGTLTKPGQNSPFRGRTIEENLDLFHRMRAGEFADGSKSLRAKIDMTHPNLLLRDPVMYRIRRAHHYRQGDAWCVYPTYDWAHGQCDSIEGVTHSICTLEFEVHRPLYDWFLDQLGIHHPRQIEFARLYLSHTLLSKRKLLALVHEGVVEGWDDPRMPTVAALRRRGYPPAALRRFAELVGVAKVNSIVELAFLESCVREELNRTAPRAMAVLRPLKVVLTNYPEGKVEELDCINNPEDAAAGTRKVPFGRELYVEREDFLEDPPKKFFRLSPGREVRLRYAYFITCTEVIKDPATGEVTELRCTYDPATRGGDAPDHRSPKATLHWIAAASAVPAEVRLYETLFTKRDPSELEEGEDWKANLNPKSIEILPSALVEPSLQDAEPESRYQFERQGYFTADRRLSRPGRLVFNRTVTLRDSWARIVQSGKENV
jgi:glutaminyl-tRNA synthetase